MNERILQKSGRIIKEYLSVIAGLEKDCLDKFTIDPVFRGAMLHYLYLVADSCISLAEMLIREKRLRPPQSYYESFDILGESGILEAKFAQSFARIAGFRNFLAHDYEVVDAEIICREALNQLDEVKEFLRQVHQP